MKQRAFPLRNLTVLTLAAISGVVSPRALGDDAAILDYDTSYLTGSIHLSWGSDPFSKQPGFLKEKPVDLVFELNGIVYSKKDPVAIINGESVMIGDMMGDRTVESIGKNYVTLRKGDSLKELVLAPVEEEGSGEYNEDQ